MHPVQVPRIRLLVMSAAIVALVLSTAAPGATASAPPSSSFAASSPGGELLYGNTQTPIKHVIIAIYENHAFDNYMSQFLGPTFGDPPGGVPQPTSQFNTTGYNIPYYTNWNYATNESSDVPDHDVQAIHGNVDNGSMDGYDYTDTATSTAMFPSYINPNLLGLAQQYGVGDSYFHAFAGPTLPNRFYYYADTSGPIVSDSGPSNNTVFFNTMPRELQDNGLSWVSYDGNFNEYNGTTLCDIPAIYLCDDPSFYFTTTLSQLTPMLYLNWIQQYAGSLGHLQPYDNIEPALASDTLPAVTWYTPDWVCCTEHPGTIDGFGGNITQGEQSLLELVYDVEQSPEWNSTAIFVSFDEGGGFYDHVPSPEITPYGDGVRMPLLVISPYAKEGYVDHTYLTPSSLLHFIEYNWGLPSLQQGAPGLDTESNLPLGFFNFSEAPRLPFPRSIPGANNLTSYPWPYTQPVAPGYLGTYQPALDRTGSISWSLQTDNVILAPPAETSDGTHLYEVGMDGFVRAFDPVLGTELWTGNLGQASRAQPTLLPNDGVLVATLRGGLMAYSSAGMQLWNISLGAPIYTGLTTVQGAYYGVLSNGTLFGVTGNGTVLFEHQVTGDEVYAPPAYDPSTGLLLVSDSDFGITAANLQGVVQWNASIPGGVYAEGAVSNGVLYVTSVGGDIYPILTSSGVVGTPANFGASSVTSPVIVGSTLYAGNESGYFAAYSLPSLSPSWSENLYGGVSGKPAFSGNDIWVASDGGYLYEFPNTGGAALQTLQSGTTFYAGPLATPTGLYIGGDDGNLLAINEGGELHLGVTPTTATVSIGGSPVTLTGGHAFVGLPSGPTTVIASAPGDTTQTATPNIVKGGVTWLNMSLVATVNPGTLAGSVFNASSSLPLASISVLVMPTMATATTLSAGTFSLPLNPGTYSIFVNATGYKPFVLAGVVITSSSTTNEQIGLTPLHTGGGVTTGTLAGTVTNASSSQPLSGISVLVLPTDSTSVTSATGGFTLSLHAGTYSIFVNASGYEPSVTDGVVITAGQATDEPIALTPVPATTGSSPGTLAGSVFNASSSATLASVALLVMPTDASATTQSDGSFSLSLAAGTYSIFVNATGYQPFVDPGVVITAGHTTTEQLGLTPVAPQKSPGSPGASGGGGNGLSSPDLLILALLAAIAVAAILLAVAVVRRGKRREEDAQVMSGAVVAGGAEEGGAMAPDDGATPPSYEEPPATAGEAPGGSWDEVAPSPLGGPPPTPPSVGRG